MRFAALALLLAGASASAATFTEQSNRGGTATATESGDGYDVSLGSVGPVHIAVTPPRISTVTSGNATEGATVRVVPLVDADQIFVMTHEANGSDFVTIEVPRTRATGLHRVGDGVKPPKVIDRVEPFYSTRARKARVSGIVILQTVIDEGGRVSDAFILKDLPYGLGQAALDAVRQWQFEPATVDGAPVPVVFNLTVNFKLN